VFAVKKR
ncbi:Malate-2H(+)/Na(+)-lactate antiporter, partial [Haemophilus influenzae]